MSYPCCAYLLSATLRYLTEVHLTEQERKSKKVKRLAQAQSQDAPEP